MPTTPTTPLVAPAADDETGGVASPARILLLEDSDIDADLLLTYLRRGGARYTLERAVRRAEFEAALEREPADVVLADYSLPDFDGMKALLLTRERWPDVPFIFVSGVLGEDIAAQAVRTGATDYVLKRNMAALPAAVQRALAERRERSHRQRAEMLFRMAAEAADIGIWELDVQRQTLWFDDSMRALVGFGPPPLPPLDRMVDLIVHADDRQLVRDALAPAMAPDSSGEFEYAHRALHQRTGRSLWLAVKGRRISGPDNRVRLVGTARDVTEERRRDEALRVANLALEERVAERTRERDRMWNLSVDLMHVLRPDGTLAAVNPAWERMLGWHADQLIESPFIDLVAPDDRPATRHALQQLARGEMPPPFDSRLLNLNGSQRWIRWTASADAGLIYAVGRDITEERAAADELAAANRALKAQIQERGRVEATLQQMQRLEAVGQLTSGVAHDFNNLLAVVLSNISLIRILLERQPHSADPRVLQRLQSMQNASERGGKLIAQLLAFSRRQRLEPSVLDVNDVLRGMRDLLQTTMGGTVHIDTALHEPLWHALVDPTQLELIVLNLAINARDAMEVGGTLTVLTANATLNTAPTRPEEPDPGEYVQLTVADSGSGIPPAVLAKVFEPFFTTKDVGKGSGLGLAQVYGFAKQSGGGVRIDTQPGLGTSVHVFVPRARQSTAEVATVSPAPGSAAETQAPHAGYKLLLVDDDDAVREVTGEVLEQYGYTIVQAAGGAQALQVFDSAGDIDLVLADFAMPGMNGAELRRQLLARQPGLRVLIITGYADLGALHDVEEDMVLQKPVYGDQLVQRLRKWLPAAPRSSGMPVKRT